MEDYLSRFTAHLDADTLDMNDLVNTVTNMQQTATKRIQALHEAVAPLIAEAQEA